MKITKYFIKTEEYCKKKDIQVICTYLNINFSEIKIKPVMKYINQYYCRVNKNVIFYIEIISGTGCFVDYIVYKDIIQNPILLVECTKSNTNESGNQFYQRIVKFIISDFYYKDYKKLMIYNTEIQSKKYSKTFEISCIISKTIGIDLYHSDNIKTNYGEFQNLQHMENIINSTNNTKNNNRMYIKDNHIELNINLKNGDNKFNDPNVGFCCGVISCIRKFTDTKIIINNHNINDIISEKTKTKLVQCFNIYKNIELFDVKYNANIFPKECYFNNSKSEKNASIFLHNLLTQSNRIQIVFSNHASCSKDYLNINGNNIQVPKQMKIPDLCFIHKKCLFILESKLKKYFNKGIEQLCQLDSFEKLCKEQDQDNLIYEKAIYGLIIYGDSEFINEDIVKFQLLHNNTFKINLGIKNEKKKLKSIF